MMKKNIELTNNQTNTVKSYIANDFSISIYYNLNAIKAQNFYSRLFFCLFPPTYSFLLNINKYILRRQFQNGRN